MKLVRDTNPGAYAVRVPCIVCGESLRLADAEIDLDGPAYRAYYHPHCLPAVAIVSVEPTESPR